MSTWRCCCPAHGKSANPEHALLDHWARACPGRPQETSDE